MNNPQPNKRSEKGQALMLLIVGIVGLFGFAALAIDGGMIYSDRRHAQNAADTAALAGAYQLAKITATPAYNTVASRVTKITNAASVRAESNDFKNDTDTTVTISYPPVSGPYQGNQQYVQVKITDILETNLAHFVFGTTLTTSVEAVARAEPGSQGPLYDGHALVSLAPHQCMRFKAHGNQNTIVNGGGIFVNSDQPTCAMTMNGASGWVVSSDPITVVGGIDDTSHLCKTSQTVNGNVVCTEMATIYENIGPNAAKPFPPEIDVTPPTCPANAVKTGSSLSPGNVTGQFPPSGVTTLQSGIYCVNGDFRVNAGQVLSGSEVLIYMIDGGITWNGQGIINLTAPTTGTYKGMLIFVDPQGYGPVDTSDNVDISGGADITFTGTIYAPNSEVNLLGNENANAFQSQIIGFNIEVGGTADLQINYNEGQNYVHTYPPGVSQSQ